MATFGTPRRQTAGTLGRVIAGTQPGRYRPMEEGTPPTTTIPTTPATVDMPSGYGLPVDRYTGPGFGPPDVSTFPVEDVDSKIAKFLEDIFGDRTSGKKGLTTAEKIAQQKFEASKRGAQAQADYLRGLIGQGVAPGVSAAIEAQRKAGESYIGERAQGVLDELARRRTEATGVTGGAYDALRNYLAANAPTAYAQAQRAVPQVAQTALGQYMSGQGVSPAAAQEAVQLANVQAAGGASNYNQLLNVLAAREAAAQTSRLGETEMARATASRGLESLYGAGILQVEQQRAAALADLANRIASSRLAAEQQAAARDRAIQDALGGLLGTGYVTQPVVPAAPGATPLEQLRALTANAAIRNPALAQRVAKVSPQASLAQILAEFPRLGARIRQ